MCFSSPAHQASALCFTDLHLLRFRDMQAGPVTIVAKSVGAQELFPHDKEWLAC